jgi:hypothetical protein
VVHTSRVEYSDAMAAGFNELVLLNLVRMRYRDTPQFLEVSSLATEHLLGGSVAVGATVGDGNSGVDVGIGGIYEERPKVVYTPLAGEAVVEKLLTPIEVPTLYLLMRSGWSIERVLRLGVREMRFGDGPLLRNAPSADGPTPDYLPDYRDFRRVTEELRVLQRQRRLRLDVRCAAGDCAAAARSGGDGGDDGGKSPGGHAGSASFEPFLLLDDAALARGASCLRRALGHEAAGLGSGDGGLPPPPPETSEPSVAFALAPGWAVDAAGADGRRQREAASHELRLYPRSLMGVFYFLSQAVHVPAEHAGWVTASRGDAPSELCGGDLGDWALPASCGLPVWSQDGLDWSASVLGDLFAVRTSPHKPADAFVAVQYRGHWFYVPDCDLQSKSTFSLLSQLFALQSGDPKERAANVILSLGG